MFNLNETICKPNVSVTDFAKLLDKFLLHLNVRSLNKNVNKIDELLITLLYSSHVIIISETKLKKKNYNTTFIKNYCFHSIDFITNSGGIGIYLHNSLNYKIRPDLRLNKNLVEDIWVEIKSDNDNKSYIVGEIYFHTHLSITTFQLKLEQTIDKINSKRLKDFILGDFNINLLSDNSTIVKYKKSLESFGVQSYKLPDKIHE